MSSNKIDKDFQNLKNIAKSTSKFFNKMTKMSENINSKSSSVLYGVIGGGLGALIGIVLAPYLGLPVEVLYVISVTLGISIGTLIFRRDNILLEKSISKNRMTCDEVLSRIEALPIDAPEETRELLWSNYNKLNGVYVQELQELTNKATPRQKPLLASTIKDED